MAFLQLEDYNGSIELVVFSDLWEKFRESLKVDAIMGFVGKIDTSRGEAKLVVESIHPPQELKEIETTEIHVRLSPGAHSEEELYSLRSYLFDHKGPCSLYLHLNGHDDTRETVIKASGQITLSGSREVIEGLKKTPSITDVWTA